MDTKKDLYDLNGTMTFNEQMFTLKGRLIFNEKEEIEGPMEENPGKKKYFVTGDLIRVDDELILDLMESPMKIGFPNISYMIQKKGPSIEGKYIGGRREDIPTGFKGDDSKPLKSRIEEIVKKSSIRCDNKAKNVSITLIYKGKV